MPSQFSGMITGKHLLLDTCVLAKAYQYCNKSDNFDRLFSFFENANTIPVINEFIRFEYFRGCRTLEHLRKKRIIVDKLSKATLPISSDLINNASEIANLYAYKNIGNDQISLVDCAISAHLLQHEQNLVLVTLNHRDFPLLLHDRIGIHAVDMDDDIITLGLYKFNSEKYYRLKSEKDLAFSG